MFESCKKMIFVICVVALCYTGEVFSQISIRLAKDEFTYRSIRVNSPVPMGSRQFAIYNRSEFSGPNASGMVQCDPSIVFYDDYFTGLLKITGFNCSSYDDDCIVNVYMGPRLTKIGSTSTITVTTTTTTTTTSTTTSSTTTSTTIPVSVVFNIDIVKVGIGANRTSETAAYPVTTPATYPHRLTAMISPKSADGSVSFDSSAIGRVTIVEVARTDMGNAKQVILKVTGVTKTPSSVPDGDCDVRALCGGVARASAKVIVIAPDHIAQPYPHADGDPTPQNMVENADTSPAILNCAEGKVELYTEYLHWLPVAVQDQFNHPLDSLYAGASVTEDGQRVNLRLDASGTYQDPVGISRHPSVFVVDLNSAAALAWPSSATLPLVRAETLPNNFNVEVDAIALTPAVNRQIIVTPPGHVQIAW